MSGGWLDDVEGEDAESDDSETLFAENLRSVVGEGDVESLNVQTIEENIEDIDDLELLAEAADQDSRQTAEPVYKSRIGDLNEEQADDDEDTEETDASEETESTDTETDEEETDGGQAESEDPSADEPTEDTPDDAKSVSGNQESPSGTSEDDEAIDDSPEVEVDVSGIAPSATTREEAAERQKERSLLVWGQEGCGKSHVAHTAPGPIAYLDTEGKADELAEKFDKEVYYFQPDNYQEAADALDEALNLLAEYRQAGVTGTLVVDSLTVIWDYAKQDYAELAYPSAESHEEVDFQSALEGENDWMQIKRRHNTEFRDRIVQSPYHVVFTATAKEDYNAVLEGDGGKPMIPDGERHNPYAVKDVVRLRVNDAGITVGDLHKAARVRRSFMDLEWPDWDGIYAAIDRIADAEQSDESVDVSTWDIDIVDGKPTYVEDDDDE